MGLPPEAGPPGVWLRTTWVRRRYYVEDGYIKPIPGSREEKYNPFDAYYGAERAEEGRSLYLELVELDEKDPRAIEEFCSRWGILGLFWQDQGVAEIVRTPFGGEHWLPLDARKDTVAETLGRIRAALEFRANFADKFDRTDLDPEDIKILGKQAAGVDWANTIKWPEGLGWIWSDGWASSDQDEGIRMASFDTLCESVEQFGRAVAWFRSTYVLASRYTARLSHPEEIAKLESNLALYVNTVRPNPVFHGDLQHGRWAWEWHFPSLLAAAYMMLFLDLIGGRNLRFCADEACRKPFVADRSDKLYCSPKCLNRAKQREWRRKDPEGYNRKRRERRRNASELARGTGGPGGGVEAKGNGRDG